MNSGYCKTILVTCATSGLGEVISRDLANQGDTLILTGRNMDKLKKLKQTLDVSHNQKHHIVQFDFEDNESITRVISDLGQVKLDGVVLLRPRMDLPAQAILNAAEWNKAINISYSVPMEMIYRLKQRMNNPSSIVVIAGITSSMYIAEYGNSSVLQTMWASAVKNLSYQLSKEQIRVNAVSPYTILTNYHVKKIGTRAQQNKTTYEKQLQKEIKDIPSLRYGEPSDVSHVVRFLLSNESSFINGTNIKLDGGLSKAY